MPDRQDRKPRTAVLNGLGTLIAIILLVILLRSQGWDEIWLAFKAIPFWRLGLALLLTLVSRFAVTARWHSLLVSAKIKISFRQSLQITFAGLFASQFLPSTIGGDVIRLAGLLRLGKDRAISLASLVVDRLVGMAGMGLAALLLIFYFPELKGVSAQTSRLLPSGIQSMLLGLAVAGAGDNFFQRTWRWMIRAVRKLWQALLIWLHTPVSLLVALGFTWIHMLCIFTSIWLILPSLGESMPFGLITGLWSLTYFITLIPISLNGLGIQELSITFFFTRFGGLSLANSLTIALLLRILPMLVSLPGAVAIPGLLSGQIGQKEAEG